MNAHSSAPQYTFLHYFVLCCATTCRYIECPERRSLPKNAYAQPLDILIWILSKWLDEYDTTKELNIKSIQGLVCISIDNNAHCEAIACLSTPTTRRMHVQRNSKFFFETYPLAAFNRIYGKTLTMNHFAQFYINWLRQVGSGSQASAHVNTNGRVTGGFQNWS